MIATIETQVKKWRYVVSEDAQDTDYLECPICHSAMHWVGSGDYHKCYNDKCGFYQSETVQAVLSSLMEDDPDDPDLLVQNCEIARTYTLEDDQPETFHINSRESAGWLVKKLARKQAVIDEINAEVDARVKELQAEINSLNNRREDMLAEPRRSIIYLEARYGAELEEWARGEIAGGKTKSVKLSYGTVGIKKTQPQNIIDSEEDAIVFAEWLEDPEEGRVFVNVKKSVFKKPFFEYLASVASMPGPVMKDRIITQEDGTIILLEDNPFEEEGQEPKVIAHITPASEEFYVKAQLPVVEVQ